MTQVASADDEAANEEYEAWLEEQQWQLEMELATEAEPAMEAEPAEAEDEGTAEACASPSVPRPQKTAVASPSRPSPDLLSPSWPFFFDAGAMRMLQAASMHHYAVVDSWIAALSDEQCEAADDAAACARGREWRPGQREESSIEGRQGDG